MSDRGVLVLGASGRLGAMLRSFWPDSDVVWHGRSKGEGLCSFDLLAQPEALIRAAHGMGTIVCLAGVTPSAQQKTGVGMGLNVELGLAAIRGAAEAGVPRVLLASSAAVYGRSVGLLREDQSCEPVSDYGRAKLEMERQGMVLGQDLGVEVCSLRIGNVAGADAILGGWRTGFSLDRLPSGKTPRRSYIGPRSLSLAIHALHAAKQIPDCVNVAAPGSVEMGALLDAAQLPWTPRAAGPEVIEDVTLATGRLSQHIELARLAGTPEGLVAEWAEFRNRTQQDR